MVTWPLPVRHAKRSGSTKSSSFPRVSLPISRTAVWLQPKTVMRWSALPSAQTPLSPSRDVEIRRPGKSYTIDTVRQLQQEYGAQTQLFFLIGLDAFLDFPSWRDPQTLLTLCSFVVLSRPGLSFRSLSTVALLPPIPYPSLADLDAGRISRIEAPIGTHGLICLKLPPCAVSASDIRTRIRQGLSAVNLLPPLVESYILHHHLYQEDRNRTNS